MRKLVLVAESVAGFPTGVRHVFETRVGPVPRPARCLMCGTPFDVRGMAVIGSADPSEHLVGTCSPELLDILAVMAS